MVVNEKSLPVQLRILLEAGQWALLGSNAGLLEAVAPADPAHFELYPLERMERETQQLRKVLEAGNAQGYGLASSRESLAEAQRPDRLDIEQAVAIGGSTGAEDMLVLDYRASSAGNPAVLYFDDTQEGTSWRVVAHGFEEFLRRVLGKPASGTDSLS